jgi:hypothetical protein
MVPFVRVLLWTLVRFPTCVYAKYRIHTWSTGDYCLAYRQNSRVYSWSTSRYHLPTGWYVLSHLRHFSFSNNSSELKELIALHSSVGE